MKRGEQVARKLDQYQSMRDFSRTPEPSGEEKPGEAALHRFVIQEHHATALHWDLRLERDGVLVSFAIPHGIPPDPKENHLAVHTEDHPLEYLDFEGHIPEGSYGAGDMFIWDRGTYETHKFRDSEVMVTFHGERVQGKYVLFQTNKKDWMIHRMDPPHDSEREPLPASVAPMLALLSEKIPRDDRNYAFEVKWDGIRAILFVKGGRLRIQSRNLLDITAQYPELRALAESLGSTEAVLDGEILAMNEQGHPDFGVLQKRMGLTGANEIRRRMKDTPVVFFAFDLLYLNGHSTMGLPYTERRCLLEELELEGPNWKTPAYHVGDGASMLASSKAQGLEGVVAKKLDSIYYPGRRNNCWLKIKNSLTEEFVIGGWTPGEGARAATIGALLIGYYDEADDSGGLTYVGKVGTGFTDKFLAELLPTLKAIERDESPFTRGARPPKESRLVEPQLVAEVAFTEFTHDGNVRHPSFKRLRPDRDAPSITRAGVVGPVSTEGEQPIQSHPEEMDTAPLSTGRKAPRGRVEVVIENRALQLSNLGKVLYPATGFTKAEVIDYYTRIAPALLPHLKDRPMTLKRYPDGVDKEFFYEKQAPSHTPKWVKTAPVWSGSNKKTINYVLVNDLPTLAWLANLATLEMHPLLARAPDVHRPDWIVFDLDPGAPADLVDCADVALWLRELFGTLGLQSFAKTSGSKGMQIYVPLHTPVTYEQTKPFAQVVAQLLEKQHPDRVTSNMNKAVRGGKIFIDWSQNDEHKTTVAVYSLRARERPTVSTPLDWEEVEEIARKRDAAAFVFEAGDVLDRVERMGDVFEPLLTLEQELPRFG